MPASITHELVAWEALDALPKETQKLIFAAPDYYILGAQGPDLFFFYKPFSRSEGNLGGFLHRKRVLDWCSAMLKVLPNYTGEEFEKCLAYALGYCTHLAADITFHPFVYNYLTRMDAPRFTHQEIENDWDVYFLKELRGAKAWKHNYPFDLGKIAADGILYRFLAEAMHEIGRELSATAFRRMCRGFALYLRHAHASHGQIFRFVGMGRLYPREMPDPTYLRGKNFSALAEGKGKNADELFRVAAEESAVRISAFLEAFNADMVLPDSLFSLHLLTGKQIRG